MNEEQKEQLLELVAGLATADELREFAKETLGINVAHNAGEDAIRKKILAQLEPDGGSDEPEGDSDETDAPNDAPSAAAAESSQPAPQDSDEEAPKPRLLKNTKNGRTFGYTKALAKLKHMVEV